MAAKGWHLGSTDAADALVTEGRLLTVSRTWGSARRCVRMRTADNVAR